ncbi:MAG: lipopolysaccharide biosynthesis protein [Patescibacteria group bacterium]
MSYFRDILRGLSWMGGLRGGTRAIAFIKILILARILSPNEFGLFGIAMLFLSLLEIISETGVNIFLIQEGEDIDSFLDTAWVVSILRGTLISLILFLFSPVISRFFNSPQSLNVMYLISVAPLIRGFINPAIIKFQKNLLFAKEFTFRLIIYLLDASVAIVAALVTHSAISLVYGLLAGAVFEVVASHLFIKPNPKLRFVKDKLKLIVNRGKWVTFAGIFNYLFENIDDTVVGRLLNTISLGTYQMAYKISSLPMTEVSDVIQKVTFPVYSKIAEDKERLKKAFIKSLLATSLAVLPIGTVLFFFSREVVLILLGPKWLAVIPVIKALSFFGVVRAITETTYPLFLSLKKQNYVSFITLFSILGLMITIYPLVKNFDIVGAGYSSLTGALLAIPVTVYLLSKVFK